MDSAEVQSLIKAALPGSEVLIAGEGCSFSLVVVSEQFAGLSTVKRQQTVLAAVAEPLATGALHAVSMRTFTPLEWQGEQPGQQGHG